MAAEKEPQAQDQQAQPAAPTPPAPPAPPAEKPEDCGESIVIQRMIGSLSACKVNAQDPAGGTAQVVLPGFYIVDLESPVVRSQRPQDGVVTKLLLSEEEAEKLPRLPEGRMVEITLRVLPKEKPQAGPGGALPGAAAGGPMPLPGKRRRK